MTLFPMNDDSSETQNVTSDSTTTNNNAVLNLRDYWIGEQKDSYLAWVKELEKSQEAKEKIAATTTSSQLNNHKKESNTELRGPIMMGIGIISFIIGVISAISATSGYSVYHPAPASATTFPCLLGFVGLGLILIGFIFMLSDLARAQKKAKIEFLNQVAPEDFERMAEVISKYEQETLKKYNVMPPITQTNKDLPLRSDYD